ncbi:3-oxoacyl-ACP synthase III family protein [Streptomyces syringium]|uniref:3-oxoacyl-ACP synthase III family protein n=1 Tax=Streptomyces syringium TaxID=76729 RepID=UPI0036E6E513
MSAHLPESRISTPDLEAEIAAGSPDFDIPRGMIERLTGVTFRHVRPAGWEASDLAVAAAGKALTKADRDISDVDLLIFAAMSTDVLEPATAHIVAAKLGADCPVFDVKNACNSFLNALEIGDSLIKTGAYRRILVCCGESLTQMARRKVSSPREFISSMTAYTASDAGAAVVLEPSDEPGILALRFSALSTAWGAGVLPLPGRAQGRYRQHFDVAGMRNAFHELHDRNIDRLTEGATGITLSDVSLFCAHLAVAHHIPDLCEKGGVPQSRLTTTIASHGNTAAATLPLQLDLALREDRLGRGGLAVLLGHASGISQGVLAVRM